MKRNLYLVIIFSVMSAQAQVMSTSIGGAISSGISMVTGSQITIESPDVTKNELSQTLKKLSSYQLRGVAERDQIRDDLVLLDHDILNRKVIEIEGIRQASLRELFIEIANDEKTMKLINAKIIAPTKLQRIAIAVSMIY